MDNLENQLKYMYFPLTDSNYYLPNWSCYLLGVIDVSLIVVCLICFKCRKRIKKRLIGLWNAKGDSGEYRLSVLPTYQEAKTQGSESRTVTSSAPPADLDSDVPLLPPAETRTTVDK